MKKEENSEAFDTVDDMMESLHKSIEEDEKKHPWRPWIDNVVFKNVTRIGDYRPSYALTHPWTMVAYALRQVKYAFQRAFRGWDETVIWSIDYHLSEMIPIWMRELKKDKMGVPNIFFHEGDEIVHDDGTIYPSDESVERARKEWEEVLENVAVGFESYTKRDAYEFETPEEEAEITRKFEEGFDLLHKYWGAFWD